jgi:hypothetical protein
LAGRKKIDISLCGSQEDDNFPNNIAVFVGVSGINDIKRIRLLEYLRKAFE